MIKSQVTYDRKEQTAQCGEPVLRLCKEQKPSTIVNPVINQLIHSATSIGANYMEANNASSPKDFRNKIYICKKEAQETKHWLRMLRVALTNDSHTIVALQQEVSELTLIFQKIISTLEKKRLTTSIEH